MDRRYAPTGDDGHLDGGAAPSKPPGKRTRSQALQRRAEPAAGSSATEAAADSATTSSGVVPPDDPFGLHLVAREVALGSCRDEPVDAALTSDVPLADDASPRVVLTPRPGLVQAPPRMPLPGPVAPAALGPTPGQERPAPGSAPPTAAPGTVGDVMKAIVKVPTVASWLERTKTEHLRELDRLTTGEAVVVATHVLSSLAAVGIAAPAARDLLLGLLDGVELEVPGAPGLKLKTHTGGGSLGASVQLDLVKIVPALK